MDKLSVAELKNLIPYWEDGGTFTKESILRIGRQLADAMRETEELRHALRLTALANERTLELGEMTVIHHEAREGSRCPSANPVADLGERKLPPVLDAYKRKVEPKPPKHFNEDV